MTIRPLGTRGANRASATVVLLCAFLAAPACGGAERQRSPSEESESEMVGAPPSEAEAPFRIAETPAPGKKAGRSGSIEPDEDADAGSTPGEGSASARVSEAKPSKEGEVPDASGEARCFSCVRICPLTGSGEAQCGKGERDVICGWGVHETPETARKLARAECNGALEMARQMETWSRIEGECPQADCRNSGT